MGEAYECDRCGGLNDGTPHSLITVGDGMERRGKQDMWQEERPPNPSIEAGNDHHYDVCPGCRSEFEEWWGHEDA